MTAIFRAFATRLRMLRHYFMSDLIEALENADILRGNRVNQEVLARKPLAHLIELSEAISELTPTIEANTNTVFTHTASHCLGGGPVPCAALNCRMRHAAELSQFAALYSDRVYITNFISRHRDYSNNINESLRKSFFNDVKVLGLLRPLIETGRIIPITPRSNVCLHCLARQALDGDPHGKFDAAYKHFTNRYANEVKFSVRQAEQRRIILEITKSHDLVEHDSVVEINLEFKERLKNYPQKWKHFQEGKSVAVSKELAKQSGFPQFFARQLFENITFELSTSQCLHTGLLTSNPNDIEILTQLSGDIRLQKRNQIIRELLTSNVPFIQEMTPTELVKLREAETDSFVLFRAALAKAAENVKQEGASITRDIAETLFADVIEPELSKLNLAVKKARRGMLQTARRSVLGWTAAISFGVYNGFISDSLREAAKALGFTKILADFASKLMSDSDVEESIRHENMYFLWKVQQAASKVS